MSIWFDRERNEDVTSCVLTVGIAVIFDRCGWGDVLVGLGAQTSVTSTLLYKHKVGGCY